MPSPRSCCHPAAIRSCSGAAPASVGGPAGCDSEWTSQIACARKAASKAPARNCGRPKRSRVKNLVIRQDEVFYHERACLGETSKSLTPKDTKVHEGAMDKGGDIPRLPKNPAPD